MSTQFYFQSTFMETGYEHKKLFSQKVPNFKHIHCCQIQVEMPISNCYRPQTSLCFYTYLSFCPRGGVPTQVLPSGPGRPGSPPPCDQVHPWDQVHPQDQVHPLDQVAPQDQVHPPGTRHTSPYHVHPPRPGTPPVPGTPPRPGTPPGTRYTPLGPGTPPLGPGTLPREQCMLGDTGNKRAVRILLESILVLDLNLRNVKMPLFKNWCRLLFVSKILDTAVSFVHAAY